MRKHFRLYITVVIVMFAIFITFVVALFDEFKMKEQLRNEFQLRLATTEERILDSLHTIDKVYHLFDDEIASQMEQYSRELLALYEKNPNVEDWDYATLHEKYGMDIFILNEENVVVHSSFTPDIGLDFSACCSDFARLLDERRATGQFFHDGMDLQQKSGEIKKFSYMPTPDRKYVIELGVSLEDGEVFKQFNFLELAERLEEQYSFIDEINIYNYDGYNLKGKNENREELHVAPERLDAFHRVLETGEPLEVAGRWNGKDVIYRYVPYKALSSRGLSTNRFVEMIYNESDLHNALQMENRKFFIQLTIILSGAILLSLWIARLIGKPLYLAAHDSLTGLKNRAAYEAILTEQLQRKDQLTALMMMDLDNFKQVNDQYGHMAGDRILQRTAEIIEKVVGKKNVSARLGGDEFVVIIPDAQVQNVEKMASRLIQELNRSFSKPGTVDVSISIGIAYAEDGDNGSLLYQKADMALYHSKENGKNQYNVYGESLAK